MPLNDVTFETISGGLGRVAAGEDHVSAIVFSGSAPTAWGSDKIRLYRDLQSAEQDGITEGDATYGEAWYHIREFFRVAGAADLYVCFGITFPDDLLVLTDKVRQVGGFIGSVSEASSVWQAAADAAEPQNKPFVAIVGYDNATTPLVPSSATDLNTLSAPAVSVVAAGDGGARGAALASSLGKPYIPAVGAVLGAVAKAKVHESIAWVERFNMSDGEELESIMLSDGTVNPTVSNIQTLNDKRYLCFRKHAGIGGTYLADSHSAVISTDDFAYIEANRTMQKAKRLVRAALLPQLNAPLTVDGDTGKLAAGTVRYFEGLTERALNTMTSNNELSAFGVFINPDQDVLATSKLIIQVKLVPRGVARSIVVQIGFSVNTEF
ncbi:MAG: DUF2586 family protein [Deltaproteobacteria bacterium]|nr:MAG: DUF2586 family protein [Deltaproteobacteria bacterium]